MAELPMSARARDEFLLGLVEGGVAYAQPLLAEAEHAGWAELADEDAGEWGAPEAVEPADPDAVTGDVDARVRSAEKVAADRKAGFDDRAHSLGFLTGYGALRTAYQDAYVGEPWALLIREALRPMPPDPPTTRG